MTDSFAAARLARAPRLPLGTLWQIQCPNCGQWITQFSPADAYGTEHLADHKTDDAPCPMSGEPLERP